MEALKSAVSLTSALVLVIESLLICSSVPLQNQGSCSYHQALLGPWGQVRGSHESPGSPGWCPHAWQVLLGPSSCGAEGTPGQVKWKRNLVCIRPSLSGDLDVFLSTRKSLVRLQCVSCVAGMSRSWRIVLVLRWRRPVLILLLAQSSC